MLTIIQQLGSEFEFLRSLIALAEGLPNSNLDCGDPNVTLVEALRERFSSICFQAMETAASRESDLIVKAKIVLNWVNPDDDWVHAFAALLSRDVLRITNAETATDEPSTRTSCSDRVAVQPERGALTRSGASLV